MTARFDIYRNAGKGRAAIPYVVVVESAGFNQSRRRVVVPLVSAAELNTTTRWPDSAIHSVFTIEGVKVILNPLVIVSIPMNVLGERMDPLVAGTDAIIAALDSLFTRDSVNADQFRLS